MTIAPRTMASMDPGHGCFLTWILRIPTYTFVKTSTGSHSSNGQQLYKNCLDTRQPGSVFKILQTRQSEIILEFPRRNSSNLSLNCRSLFRNVKQL